MPDRQKYHERIIDPVQDPLSCVVGLAERQGRQDYICYEGPGGWAVASGIAAELTADRNGITLRGPGATVSVPWGDQPLRQVARLLATVPVQSWRAYGWGGFDLAPAKDGLLALVGDGRFLHLVIPRTEIRFEPGGTVLRCLDRAELDVLRAGGLAPSTARHRPEPVAVEGAGAEDYMSAVRACLKEIESERLQKVILSRTVPVDFPVDLVATYHLGRRANTPARSFLFALDGMSAAGFSPETVLEVSPDRVVTTQPLAGTRARTGVAAADALLREELLSDVKEIYEHVISVRTACAEVAQVCDASSVRITEFMAVRERGSVQHLASSVRGTLASSRDAWDAFAALFPSVTASGVPKRPAYEVIREHEGTERGLYAGAVMTCDSAGAMDVALVLRAVFRQHGRSWLRAGAGIVEQSRPEREFTETCEKLSSVARYLVPDRGPAG